MSISKENEKIKTNFTIFFKWKFSASFKYLLSIKIGLITVFNGSFLISLFMVLKSTKTHAVSDELNFSLRSFLWMLLISVKQVTVIADVDSLSC